MRTFPILFPFSPPFPLLPQGTRFNLKFTHFNSLLQSFMNAKQWLAKLVAFDTTSRNSNLDLIHYCKEYLEGLGVKCTLVHNAEKTKANLWATLPGDGGVTDGGIILSGHTDVVPVDGQKWDSDPFTLTEKDGRLYGRGTCDMKGFIAVCMSLTPELLKMKRAKPIHFAWTYDEEIGCIGGKVLAEFLRDNNIKADGCIVGEPTSNNIVIAHKSNDLFRVRIYGKAAHSSYALTNQGCNAIDYACKLILKIREVAEEVKFKGPFDEFFDVPFTTVSTNFIKGGNAGNIIPATCEFLYEMRCLPKVELKSIQEKIQSFLEKELLPSLKKEYPDGRIEVEKLSGVPSMKESDENDPFIVLVRHLTKDSKTRKVAYATEGGHYQGIGVPVVVCGPGSILQAHQPNEFVSIDQLDGCANMIRGVALGNLNGQRSHI
ncbi:glutamamyl carboxypeptidase [Trypanosoma theileri]|uniref:Glutamamyl carboxypeptidase n=1 Tax=Trypanosoma theileri TaxID=67003 RepID=A0A1X0NKP9_9TRYP|nr:glutamamyl carboxypeptidase [Trypanosoma theileri]ORC85151.1 glutamamyl carboxypeptidase [Trypanosoma theileri]